jgi:Glycosyl hydrolase family 26
MFTKMPFTALLAPAHRWLAGLTRLWHGVSTRRRAVLATTTAVAMAGMAMAGFAPAGAASASSSKVPWASGAWLANDSPAVASQFGTWRGSALNVIDEFTLTSTWQDVIDPTWMYQKWQGSPYTLAIAVPMIPTGVSGVSIAACAAGAYNSYWNQFGSNISSYGLGHSIIRLGWEFNGNWYPWAATQPATWAQCWRQIVTSARATAPNLVWDWNVSRGVQTGLADPTQAYPGDAYVDQIGVDSYDWWPAANTTGGWAGSYGQLTQPQGLQYWLNFARAHGKQFAVPEWGNVSTTISSAAGGDDPYYVTDMYNFFQANASSLAYEGNLQGTSTDGAYWPTTTLPNSAATYKADF